MNSVDPTGLDPEDEWRAFNCRTRADMGIGLLDMAFGWQGPCDGGGPAGSDGGGHGGGGIDPQRRRTQAQTYSQACLDAISKAKQTVAGLDRAKAAMDLLKQVADKYGFDPALLAAIGIRESNFQNQRQHNGGGRGVFQLDITRHPELQAVAENPSRLGEQADYAGQILAHGTTKYGAYGADLAAAGGLREYNAGNRHNWSTKKFAKGEGGLNATVARLDRGTAHNNYVSNVLAIAKNCFH